MATNLTMGDNNGQHPRDPRESMLWDTVGSQAGANLSSPAGGPGPGRFKQFAPQGSTTVEAGTSSDAGFWDRLWDRLPHEATKAGVRVIVGPVAGILTDYLLDRYERNANYVAESCRRALAKYVGAAIEEETGEALEGMLKGLLQGLLMMMAVVATTTLIGAGAGAAVGFFGFGVGAAPGAAIGAEIGFDAGVWILNWLGIGFLAVYIGKNLGQVDSALSAGVQRAWNAGDSGNSVDQDLDAAAKDVARAIGILVRLILEGIVMYLLAKGTARVAEQLPGLLKALRESEIGKRLAPMVEKDPEGFIKKHRPRESSESGAGRGEAGEEGSPSPRKGAGEKPAMATLIEQSKAAQGRASAAAEQLPNRFSGKAVASDGQKTVSGWRTPPEGFAKATPEQVADYSKQIGYDLKPEPWADQTGSGGFPGKYNASHAEKQMAVLSPGDPIGVSKPMCPDCLGFFKQQAIATGRTEVVSDPSVTRIFSPDGSITEVPH